MTNICLTADVLAKCTVLATLHAKAAKGKYRHTFGPEITMGSVEAAENEFLTQKVPNPDGKYFDRRNAIPSGARYASYKHYKGVRVRAIPIYKGQDFGGIAVECIVTR